MVPIMTLKDLDEDPLQVFAEPYNELIVDKMGFKNQLPDVISLAPKNNIRAWVDRKFFIHNLGHATVVYNGYLRNPLATCIWEVLEDPVVYNTARETMRQSATVLMSLHPENFLLNNSTNTSMNYCSGSGIKHLETPFSGSDVIFSEHWVRMTGWQGPFMPPSG
jgi:mannitol-1-phosphate 5-dehydrogenase